MSRARSLPVEAENAVASRNMVLAFALALAGCEPIGGHAPPSRAPAVARCAECARPASPDVPRSVDLPPLDVSGESCGELLLRSARGRAWGRGERHPETLALRAALPNACADDDGASLRLACHGMRERHALRMPELGPAHPDMQLFEAERQACEGVGSAPLPDAIECAQLEADRAKLVRDGKGRAHPEMQKVQAALDTCAR
jgi:hypothetical protein